MALVTKGTTEDCNGNSNLEKIKELDGDTEKPAGAVSEALADAECVKCRKMVPFGISFCPFCGSVNLQNMLIKGDSNTIDIIIWFTMLLSITLALSV